MLANVALETSTDAAAERGTGGDEGAGADPLAREAWDLLQRIAFAHKPAIVAAAREFDLLPPHLFALKNLDRPRPMGELARMLFCDNSNVTGIVDRLEERGLVARTADEHDRRVRLLVLTPEGERVRAELIDRIGVPAPAITTLSREDKRALRDILSRAIKAD